LTIGFPVRLMSPLQFLKSPMTWLRQLSETRADISGGPNFAYDLVLRKADYDATGLDLSRWRVAFNGAEPIRRSTLEAFSDRFAATGFRPEAFLPCYGLAEATLLVTGAHWSAPTTDGGPGTGDRRVRSGPAVPGTDVAIVDPETGRAVEAGTEGEIWIHGPGVSPGYWQGPGASPRPDDRDELDGQTYLRTGDLGRLDDGELVVTGRTKDVLIHRGANYHASDIEEAATTGLAEVRPVAAAFTVDHDDAEPTSVLLVERSGSAAARELADRLRTRVLAATGLWLDAVVVAPARTVPRTSSGKVQRTLARDRYRAGTYDEWLAVGPATTGGSAATGTTPPAETAAFAALIAGVFAEVCSVDDCGGDTSLLTLGGDSLKAAEIAGILQHASGLEVPVEAVLTDPTPDELAHRLLTRWNDQGVTPGEVLDRIGGTAGQEGGAS